MKNFVLGFFISLLIFTVGMIFSTAHASPVMVGQFMTNMSGTLHVEYDEICVRKEINGPVHCVHQYENVYISKTHPMTIPLYTYKPPSACIGVKVKSVDIGLYHQDYDNCYMSYCYQHPIVHPYVDFEPDQFGNIICHSSDINMENK